MTACMNEQQLNNPKKDQELVDKSMLQSELIVKFLRGKLTDDEQRILEGLTEQTNDARSTFSELTNPSPLNTELEKFHEFSKNTADAKKKVMDMVSKKNTDNCHIFPLLPFFILL